MELAINNSTKTLSVSDAIFGRRFAAAMLETDAAKMLPTLEALTRYVHRKMGGFEIDGFRLRSPAK